MSFEDKEGSKEPGIDDQVGGPRTILGKNQSIESLGG